MRHMLLRPYNGGRYMNGWNYSDSNWTPAMDIYETDVEYVIYAEVPGVNKGSMDIQLNAGVLTIKGEKNKNGKSEDAVVHRKEMNPGEFTRSFSLPEDVDVEKISAELKDGILELKIPKAEEKKPRSIPITVH